MTYIEKRFYIHLCINFIPRISNHDHYKWGNFVRNWSHKEYADFQYENLETVVSYVLNRELLWELTVLNCISNEMIFTEACRYVRGAWSECDSKTNIRSRKLTLKKGDPANCEVVKTIQKKCKRSIHFIDFRIKSASTRLDRKNLRYVALWHF